MNKEIRKQIEQQSLTAIESLTKILHIKGIDQLNDYEKIKRTIGTLIGTIDIELIYLTEKL